MSLFKKIAVTLACFFVLLLLLNYGLSYYISKKLPSIIHAEKDFPYNISYEDLDIRLLGGSFTIRNAYLAPKDSTATQLQQGAFGKIATIEVQHFNLWALLKDNKIKVKKVIIDTPEIVLHYREKKYNANDDFVKPFKNTISTGSLEIRNGNFKMLDSLQHFVVKASNISFDLNNIRIDSATVEENIPVRYRDYNFSCDSLFYRAGNFYDITAGNIKSSDSTLAIGNFKMIPKHTRRQFNSIIAKEKDQFAITVDSINVPRADWGFFRDKLYVHTPEVVLQRVNANIYRGKMVKDDPTRKKLYSELLRSLKFDLKVDKLLLKNSVIVYEEQPEYKSPPAKVSFSKFYATISNVYSPVNKGKLPNTTIAVQCLFMKSAPLHVSWSFNTLDTSDAFTITGHLRNIKSEEVNPVSKPLMNATTTGDIEEVKFTFNGNKERARGTFALEYDDLKVTIYQKDEPKKKNKFITAVANLFVKNDSKEALKNTTVEIERAKDKSVFNFLWKFVQEGLKKTVLPKAIAKVASKEKKDKK
jgi:hypothetical protein